MTKNIKVKKRAKQECKAGRLQKTKLVNQFNFYWLTLSANHKHLLVASNDKYFNKSKKEVNHARA